MNLDRTNIVNGPYLFTSNFEKREQNSVIRVTETFNEKLLTECLVMIG